jgi:hypothetical protein
MYYFASSHKGQWRIYIADPNAPDEPRYLCSAVDEAVAKAQAVILNQLRGYHG